MEIATTVILWIKARSSACLVWTHLVEKQRATVEHFQVSWSWRLSPSQWSMQDWNPWKPDNNSYINILYVLIFTYFRIIFIITNISMLGFWLPVNDKIIFQTFQLRLCSKWCRLQNQSCSFAYRYGILITWTALVIIWLNITVYNLSWFFAVRLE